jgi:hypothetical protein
MKQLFIRAFLFFCLATPVVATVLVVRSIEKEIKEVQKTVKWKMIDGLDREELVLLKFTEEEKQNLLDWKHAREFQYQGEMYDIVSSEQHNDTTYYWCWWDYEETALNKRLATILDNTLGENTKPNDHQTKLFQFLKSLFYEADDTDLVATNYKSPQNYTCQSTHYLSRASNTPTPPPKAVVWTQMILVRF